MLPAVAIQINNEIELRAAREMEVRDNAVAQARQIAAEQERLIDGIHQVLIALAQLPMVRGHDAEMCSPLFAALQAQYPQYSALAAIDTDNLPFCSGEPLGPDVIAPADKAQLRDTITRNRFTIGAYRAGRPGTERTLMFAFPYHDRTGRPAGAVVALLSLDWLAQEMAARRHWTTNSLLIADAAGTALVRLPNAPEWSGRDLSAVLSGVMQKAEPGVTERVGADGVERVVGYVPPAAGPGGLYVGIGIVKKVAYGEIDRAGQRSQFLILAGFGLALAAAILGGRRFIEIPIERLRRAAARLSAGDYTARTNLKGQVSELDRLGRAFDEMAAELQRRDGQVRETTEGLLAANTATERALREAEAAQAQLAFALDAVGIMSWERDLATGVVRRSSNAARVLGVDAAELGTSESAFRRLAHPDDRDMVARETEAAIKRGGDFEIAFRIPGIDGRTRWILERGRVTPGADGKPSRVVGVALDISERQSLMEQKDLLLREVNHRVMNSLQLISSFLSLQAREIPNEGERERFRRAIDRVAALATVQARLYRTDAAREIEVGGYLQGLCDDLARSLIEDAPIRIVVRRAGTAIASVEDMAHLGLVIAELITNAVKYAFPDGKGGTIEVGIESTGAGTQVSVADNGVGMPPPAPKAKRGGGLGTLLVTTMVRQLGGRMETGSEQGARFVIHLPWTSRN